MSNLPLEVISDILLLLPVKSLLRFKCLSKSINAIIGSKSFASNRSFEGRISRKLIWVQSSASKLYNGKLHVLDFENNFEQEFMFNQTVSSHDKFIDECNGLLALYLLACDKACVWNPSTRQQRTLPSFPFRPNSLSRLTIGYDSSTDDYKILAISYTSVWVFRLKSNSWSRACEDFPCNVFWGGGSCFADGALHFFCNDAILAFDVSRETFSIVAKPDTHGVGDIVSLDCFGGYLSIKMRMNVKITLFVRKKDGVDFRWIKLYSVSIDGPDILTYGKVIGRSKEENKILIFACGTLISCDHEKKRIERIGIEKTNKKNWRTSNFFLCSESFVSLGS